MFLLILDALCCLWIFWLKLREGFLLRTDQTGVAGVTRARYVPMSSQGVVQGTCNSPEYFGLLSDQVLAKPLRYFPLSLEIIHPPAELEHQLYPFWFKVVRSEVKQKPALTTGGLGCFWCQCVTGQVPIYIVNKYLKYSINTLRIGRPVGYLQSAADEKTI